MWTFSLRSNLFASAECQKNVKNLRNEEFQEVENQDPRIFFGGKLCFRLFPDSPFYLQVRNV